jgi:hypothetical protein
LRLADEEISTLPGVPRWLLPLLLTTVALASCGGGEGDATDPQELIDRAFTKDIPSADLSVEGELGLDGSRTFERPVRIEATGPFRTNKGKLPSADLELRIGTDGGGQTVTTGFLSTGDRAFLEFEDVYYEQSRAAVRRANRAIADGKRRQGSLRSLGLNPRSWLLAAEDEGDEEVAGVTTHHLSGTLDVEALMRDMNRFVRRSAEIGGTAKADAEAPFSREDIRQVGAAVKDATFDLYVGAHDDIIRRVSGRVEFDVPKSEAASLSGVESGNLSFSVQFADVGGDQEIEAPARPRPLSTLNRYLGAGGLLGGLAGAVGEGDLGTSAPDVTPPAAGGDGGDSTPESGPSAEDFRDYAECLDEARPEDTEALQRCDELLQRP